MYIIDRRKNPKDKSIENRQRFIKRYKQAIRESINETLKNKPIKDIDKIGEEVNISGGSINEPQFQNSKTGGARDFILPGNDRFNEGDKEEKPSGGQGNGKGKKAGGPMDMLDEFHFRLTKEEFLDIFFEDLELPNLIKKNLKSLESFSMKRAGFTTKGSPANLNVEHSMRQALGRKIALGRPNNLEIEELEKELLEIDFACSAALRPDSTLNWEELNKQRLALEDQLEKLLARQRQVPFLDDVDMRYTLRTKQPEPITKAVMFCMMDVSGSMGEREKDLAKRFFMLLYLFLGRQYKQVDIRFIAHTTDAKEVTEEEFFYGRESGGTLISTALDKMIEIQKDEYNPAQWNIYCAQASDGENYEEDNAVCVKLLNEYILEASQYFAYIDVAPDRGESYGLKASKGAIEVDPHSLWGYYSKIKNPNFNMKRVTQIRQVWTVFRELFERKKAK